MRYLSIIVLFLSGHMAVAQASFETFSSFDGTQIAYTQEGSGRAVMLIHGFISNGDPEELQKEIPKALLKIVPGDHNNTYKSKVFADLVLDFLN